MIGLDLSICVHKKRVKMRIYLLYLLHPLIFCILSYEAIQKRCPHLEGTKENLVMNLLYNF